MVLAPADCGESTDPAPTLFATALGSAGVRVLRFSMGCKSPDPVELDAWLRATIRSLSLDASPLVLGGISRGARVSACLVTELGAAGLVALAYPFHPRLDPDPGERARLLARCPVPTLLIQGTRDSHGNRQQVRGYKLPIQVHWLEDANHALRPRDRSGHTQQAQLTKAARVAAAFIHRLGR